MPCRNNLAKTMVLLGILFFLLPLAAEARMAGGFRGGGFGYSRMGPASGGSFAARPDNNPDGPVFDSGVRQAADQVRQEERQDMPEVRRDEIQTRQDVRREVPGLQPVVRPETRQDVAAANYQQHWDAWHGGATYTTTEVTVGTVVASDDFDADSCQVTIAGSDGFTYYDCNDTWYRKAFAGGTVSYVVVDGPP
jgi:hypothetical protein